MATRSYEQTKVATMDRTGFVDELQNMVRALAHRVPGGAAGRCGRAGPTVRAHLISRWHEKATATTSRGRNRGAEHLV